MTMEYRPCHDRLLLENHAQQWLICYLFVLVVFIAISGSVHAQTRINDNTSQPFVGINRQSQLAEDKRRLKLSLKSLRDTVPKVLPHAPLMLRNPQAWLLSMAPSMDGVLPSGASIPSTGFTEEIVRPLLKIVSPPPQTSPHALWVAPDYHHEGFFPNHDAIIMGFRSRHTLADTRMHIETHPFVGQNWLRDESLYGVEIALRFMETPRALKDSPSSPPSAKGHLVIRYSQGDKDLTKDNHGFSVVGDYQFTPNLNLHAQIRQDTSGNRDDRVMLMWTIITFH